MARHFTERLEDCFRCAEEDIPASDALIWRDSEVFVRSWRPQTLDNSLCLQMSFLVQVPFNEWAEFTRPERMHLINKTDPKASAHVLKEFAPGDVVFEIDFEQSLRLSVLTLFMGKQAAVVGEQRGRGKTWRAVRRIDFPKEGLITTAFVQVNDIEAPGWRVNLYHVISAGADPGTTLVSKVYMVPRKFEWVLPAAVRLINHFTPPTLDMRGIALPPPTYTVLRIKKCCRGPPLAFCGDDPPSPAEEAERGAGMLFNGEYWAQPCQPGLFSFSTYLQDLVRILGYWDVDVFNSLDGRYVAFFQAVMRRDVWKSMEKQVQDFMHKHAAAYRHWYGGTAAPNLQADAPPMFQDKLRREQLDEDQQVQWEGLCYKNTFIHFGPSEASDDVISAP